MSSSDFNLHLASNHVSQTCLSHLRRAGQQEMRERSRMMNSRFNSRQQVLSYFFLSHVLIKMTNWFLLQRWDAREGVGSGGVRAYRSLSGFIYLSSRGRRFFSRCTWLRFCPSFAKTIALMS